MPVNLLPVLIPLACVWAAVTYILFRWRKWAGGCFLALTSVVTGICFLSTGVERWHVEPMRFEQASDDGTIFLTTDPGEKLTVESPVLAARLRDRKGAPVRAVWMGTYDFGRLRAYHIQTLDGVVP
jgi:hypothetical protein